MTMTLWGRIQTRLVLLSSVGLIWTLAISPLLARLLGLPVSLAYQITLQTSVATALLGIGWELVYHGLQQLRWDKDWPSVLSLLTGTVEGVLVWVVLHALHIVPGDGGLSSPILPLYVGHFATTWIVVWLISQGPLRVVQLRWRFEGGSFSRHPSDSIISFVVTNIGMAFALVILWLVWP